MIFVQPRFMAHHTNPMSIERREMVFLSNESMHVMRVDYGHMTTVMNEHELFE